MRPLMEKLVFQAVAWISILSVADGFLPHKNSCLRYPPSPSSSFLSPFERLLQNVKSGDDDEEDEILFEDFDFVVGDSSASFSPPSEAQDLNNRIREQQAQELVRETRLLQNWKQGDWSVRGFSLDSSDALNDARAEDQDFNEATSGANSMTPSTPIHVSKVVADRTSDGTRVWVGRSDGSLVWVQLGSEYTTHFRSKISGQFFEGEQGGETDQDTMPSSMSARFKSELVRDQNNFPLENEGSDPNVSVEDPFKILAQFSPAHRESAISTILSVPEAECIFTACEGSGQVKQWHLAEEAIETDKPALQTPLPLSEGIHTDAIVALKNIVYQESSLLLSVSAEGTMALWDIQTADIVFHCKVNIEDTMEPESTSSDGMPLRPIECADVGDNHIFLGTASGFVLGYAVSDILVSASAGICPLPQGKFKAHEGGVTALACGGPGSLGRVGGAGNANQKTSSTVLITGGADGVVKQWEILSSLSMQRMEHWPKLASQRLPKKAHIFEGHVGPITALEAMGGRRPQFLSASKDGTIRAWNTAKGKENYRMDGFTNDLSSLCVLGSSDSDDDLLVTNGMKQYVCVHDFSGGLAGNSIDDFLEPGNE